MKVIHKSTYTVGAFSELTLDRMTAVQSISAGEAETERY